MGHCFDIAECNLKINDCWISEIRFLSMAIIVYSSRFAKFVIHCAKAIINFNWEFPWHHKVCQCCSNWQRKSVCARWYCFRFYSNWHFIFLSQILLQDFFSSAIVKRVLGRAEGVKWVRYGLIFFFVGGTMMNNLWEGVVVWWHSFTKNYFILFSFVCLFVCFLLFYFNL